MSMACGFAACRGISVPATGTSRGRASRRRTRVFSSPADPGSSSPWWASLPAVHVLVFHPESDDEALYTVSRRDGDFAANDFVAFQSLRDATRASVVVSDLCGEMPVVDTVDVRVVVFLAEQCGYGVDVVPTGTAFEPPGVLIDEAKTSTSQANNKHKTNEPLAISTADLKRYLADGGDFAASTSSSREGEENSDAVSSSSETETARNAPRSRSRGGRDAQRVGNPCEAHTRCGAGGHDFPGARDDDPDAANHQERALRVGRPDWYGKPRP